jgi:phosphatidylinositol glycan class O
MPKLQSLLSSHPDATRTFRYIAEAPTTTTQRLTSMVSGGLPTFFDISNAFTARPIDEDNLIDQMKRSNWSLAFMGDTTWTNLFPASFTNFSRSFPCFNVKDLDTVDDGIWKLFLPTLRRPDTWDALIAHYLGVDHAGHSHGVNSVRMQEKLKQMDEHIAAVVEEMVKNSGKGGVFEDTLLLIAGDHGQTMGGDHGGGSPEEVDSLLAAVDIANVAAGKSKIKKVLGKIESLQGVGKRASCLENCSCGEDKNQCAEDIPQIDLVPTLATMLNLPIPFGNMGKLSPELWSLAAHRCSGDDSILEQNKALLRATAVNSEQVHRYLNTYASHKAAQFPAGALKKLNAQFNALLSVATETTTTVSSSGKEEIEVANAYLEFLIDSQLVAQQVWTQFNDLSMVLGLVLFAASLALHVGYSWNALNSLHSATNPSDSSLTWWNTLTYREIFLIFAPCIGVILHFIGLFSFFYLLSEGRCTAFILLAVTGLLTAVQTVFPSIPSAFSRKNGHRRTSELHPSFQVNLTVLGIIAAGCISLSSYVGLLGHSGYGFWQRLTVHESKESDYSLVEEDRNAQNIFFLVGILATTSIEEFSKNIETVVGPQMILIGKYVVNYGIPCFILHQIIVAQLTKNVPGNKNKASRARATAEETVYYIQERLQRLLMSFSFLSLAIYDVVEQIVYKSSSKENGKMEMSLAGLLKQAQPLAAGVGGETGKAFLVPLQGFFEHNTTLNLPLYLSLPRVVLVTSSASLLLTLLNTIVRSRRQSSSETNYYYSKSIIALIGSFLPIMLLISNTVTPLLALLCVIEVMALTALIAARSPSVISATTATAVVFSHLQTHVFFVTGHLPEFAGLQYTAGFVGYEEFHLVRSAALVVLDTFCGVVMVGLGLVLASAVIDSQCSGNLGGSTVESEVSEERNASTRTTRRRKFATSTEQSASLPFRKGSCLRLLLLLFGLIRAVAALCATLSAGIQRRHLYAWSLFAPRFVFEVFFLALTDILLVVLGWWAC